MNTDQQPTNLIPTNPDLRMTSLEIAELTNKNHFDVMRDVRNLVEQEAITESRFAVSEYKDGSGKMNPMYSLDFEASMVLVTGYDAKRRSLVIKRWLALETGEADPVIHSKVPTPRVNHAGFDPITSLCSTTFEGEEAIFNFAASALFETAFSRDKKERKKALRKISETCGNIECWYRGTGKVTLPIVVVELLKARPLWGKIKRYKDAMLNHQEIATLTARNVSTIRKHVRRMEKLGIIAPPANLAELQAKVQPMLPGMEA